MESRVFKCLALPLSIENTRRVNLFLFFLPDVGSTLSQAYVLSIVSHVLLQESDKEGMIAWHVRYLSVIPRRSDHRVQFLTGVFLIYCIYNC